MPINTLLIHAAALEMNGRAVLLPAPPGSGKSTLCAGLLHRGWRLLSDELALLDMQTALLTGMARPVNLKNASIDLLRTFEPRDVLTPAAPNTSKRTVVLMRPSATAVRRVCEAAQAAWIILPRYRAGSAATFTPFEKAATFMEVAEQSFNYDIHGVRGFRALGRLVDQCQTLKFEYSRLDAAVEQFARARAGIADESRRMMGKASTRPLLVSVLLEPSLSAVLTLPEWDLLVRQARRARLLARLAWLLEGHPVPPPVRPHLSSALLMAERQREATGREVAHIRRALGACQVPPVLLKGAAYLLAGSASGLQAPRADCSPISTSSCRAASCRWSKRP